MLMIIHQRMPWVYCVKITQVMKWLIVSIIVVATALAGFVLTSSDQGKNENQIKESQSELSMKTIIDQQQQKEAVLVDVRTPEEYIEGHAETAINYDLNLLANGQLPSITTDTKLYVYCRSGNRSSQAALILRNAGYEVEDLGGLSNISALGFEFVQ